MKLQSVLSSKRLQGRKELIAHLNGKKLTARQAALAKCYECMNAYSDGAADCRIPSCPLYPRMPYANKTPATTTNTPKPPASAMLHAKIEP